MTTKKKTTVAAKSASGRPDSALTAPQTPSVAQLQLAAFQDGVRLFTAKDFAGACEAFTKASQGPAAHIADKARSYLQVCGRKIARSDLQLHTAEDHFNYGVERLNARDIEQARFHLGHALALEPNAEHILYTLALSCGLAGDDSGACENLKRAIELEPRNRIIARQDPEFTALAQQYPALRTLLDSAPSA